MISATVNGGFELEITHRYRFGATAPANLTKEQKRQFLSQQLLYPLRFEPIYQYRLWGGRRLADLLTAPLPDFRLWRLRGRSAFTIGTSDMPCVLVCVDGMGQIEHGGATYVGRVEVFFLPAVIGACTFRLCSAVNLLEIALRIESRQIKRTEAPVKKLIVFDLDGTLAESKSSLDNEMSGLLHDLLGIVKVAVISGGDWPQFEKQVLSKLPHDQRLANLSCFPPAEQSSTNIQGIGKSFMKKISLRMKDRKSSVLLTRHSQ